MVAFICGVVVGALLECGIDLLVKIRNKRKAEKSEIKN